jgi:hypothetical protein
MGIKAAEIAPKIVLMKNMFNQKKFLQNNAARLRSWPKMQLSGGVVPLSLKFWYIFYTKWLEKGGFLRFFRPNFRQKILITLWGFFYARNRLRALKNLENASPDPKSAQKTIKNLEKSDFVGLIWGQGEALSRFFNERNRFLA